MRQTDPGPFPLPPAPEFSGLHPDLPITVTYRRLPHWRQEGATYFVTFRQADSLPASALQQVERLRKELKAVVPDFPPPEITAEDLREDRMIRFRKLRALEEKWLDAGHGSCLLRQADKREIICDAMRHFHRERYWLGAFVAMPNHCHLLIKPFEEFELGKILGSWKRWSANKLGGGSLWQEESYDQIVRDDWHLSRVLRYMAKNPISARLRPPEFELWMCEEWKAAGWEFNVIV